MFLVFAVALWLAQFLLNVYIYKVYDSWWRNAILFRKSNTTKKEVKKENMWSSNKWQATNISLLTIAKHDNSCITSDNRTIQVLRLGFCQLPFEMFYCNNSLKLRPLGAIASCTALNLWIISFECTDSSQIKWLNNRNKITIYSINVCFRIWFTHVN